jgi:hypothetical protein
MSREIIVAIVAYFIGLIACLWYVQYRRLEGIRYGGEGTDASPPSRDVRERIDRALWRGESVSRPEEAPIAITRAKAWRFGIRAATAGSAVYVIASLAGLCVAIVADDPVAIAVTSGAVGIGIIGFGVVASLSRRLQRAESANLKLVRST